jgi:hypothetical protein
MFCGTTEVPSKMPIGGGSRSPLPGLAPALTDIREDGHMRCGALDCG